MTLLRSIYIDEKEPNLYERLVRQAVAEAMKLLAADPDLGIKGFKVAVCDDKNMTLLEVEFGPREQRSTIH